MFQQLFVVRCDWMNVKHFYQIPIKLKILLSYSAHILHLIYFNLTAGLQSFKGSTNWHSSQ